MKDMPLPISPDRWLGHLFASRAAASGGVVRRSTRDIERIVGRERFLAELDRRGFRAVENAGQIIVFCNRDAVRILR
ncbi:N-(5'-phosphoribosyl)anthranilate isomerase [Salipiger abyssi]|nr:N-(5'-phosphoribosyl)anthranilate isomerase [Salipiger abyssi]